MKLRKLLTLLAVAAIAVAGSSCAPVDTSNSTEPQKLPVPTTEPNIGPPDTSPAGREALKARIEAAIAQAQQRDLLKTHGFWMVFHGILGLGPSATLLDQNTGKRINALDYIADGGELRGLRFLPKPDGVDVEVGAGTFVSQGHQDQFVAEMVQWGVSPERKFVIGGKDYTFQDFIRYSKARASVKSLQELEWAMLIIGQHYGTDITWTNNAGEEVRFEEMVRKELDKPLSTAACGGTHRLFGLTWVYHLHLRKGGKPVGIWKEVAERLATAKKKARELQNADGSFSTDFFNGPGNVPDMQLRLNTSGHIFEWLALALSDEELNEPWVQNAANTVAMMFLEIQDKPMEGGTLYHAVHGLIIYYSRVYGTEHLGPRTPHVPLLPARKG